MNAFENVQVSARTEPSKLCMMSRLFAGLSEDQIAQVASFAVMHGVICQIDGPAASQRIVLPLQLEAFQALLLQLLQPQEAAPNVCFCNTLTFLFAVCI
jgi:hypothetical protein